MYVSAFAEDGKKVFLNGKFVSEASKPDKFVQFSPSSYLRPGSNTIEISYELFGSTEFGDEVQMSELKGFQSVYLSGDPEIAGRVERWEIQTFSPAMRGREVDPSIAFEGGRTVILERTHAPTEPVAAFTWCRAEFASPRLESWSIPCKLIFEVSTDAMIYLNGRFIGRSVTVGPQKEFYLPDSFLRADNRPNVLTVLLAYTNSPTAIQTFRVEPYDQYSAKRSHVEFEW